MLGRWLLVAALALAGPAWAAKVRPGYRPNPGELCGGYPNVPMQMAKGFCAGIVVAPPPAGLFASKRQIHLPRTLLALPNGAFLVVDLGAWVPGKGAVWLMTPHPGRQPDWMLLQDRLDMPPRHRRPLSPSQKCPPSRAPPRPPPARGAPLGGGGPPCRRTACTLTAIRS